jgi:hypothetical protein
MALTALIALSPRRTTLVKRKEIAGEALVDLRRRLHPLPPKSAERRHVMRETAAL